MRVAIAFLGVFGLGVAVAMAQPPLAPDTRPRAATLLPPTTLDPQDILPVARGVADDLPANTYSTPVNQSRPAQGLWENGFDPNVRPAGGIDQAAPPGSGVPSSVPPNGDPSTLSRTYDKLKGAFGGNPPQNTGDGRDSPNANSPYRGTTPGGSVVYAGPPAWRWYGWGSPTPGANPSAPTGQYQKVSANWYSITGATPGAFPVPVTNPNRAVPGTEPPSYVATSAPRYPAPTYYPPTTTTPYVAQPATTMLPMPNMAAVQPAAPPSIAPTPLATPTAPPPIASVPVPTPSTTPTITTLPLPTPPAAPPAIVPVVPPPIQTTIPTPAVPVPTPGIPSIPAFPAAPADIPPAAMQGSQSLNQPTMIDPLAVLPTTDPQAVLPLPIIRVVPSQASEPAKVSPGVWPISPEAVPTAASDSAPAALPINVTESHLKWQPTTVGPTQGGWMSPGKPQPAMPPAAPPATQPSKPAPPAEPDRKETGAADPSRQQIIARGQVGDNAPDPVVMLIKRLCDGHATGLDVRWTGSKRLSVCFEVPGVTDAQQLVKDISARPEFVPYRIDFCVLVK